MFSTEEKVVQEVVSKINDYESNSHTFVNQHKEISNFFGNKIRIDAPKSKGISSSVVGEITRATETLATIFWKIIFSHDPNFYLIKGRPNVEDEELKALTHLLQDQEHFVEAKRQCLRGFRSYAAFGGMFTDESWIQLREERTEGTGIKPLSFLQVGFDRSSEDVDSGDWIYATGIITSARLRRLAQDDDTGSYNSKEIDLAIMDSTQGQISPRVRDRLVAAGYSPETIKNAHELVKYCGVLDFDNTSEEYIAYVVDRKYCIRWHLNRFGHRPIRHYSFIEFENEPLGYGVGPWGLNLQRDIVTNRNKVFNIITFSLYSMMVMLRSANINPSKIVVKPWNIIPSDERDGLTPIRPDIQAAQHGLLLEDKMKDDFRSMVAATSNLQAIITEATAREVTLAQNEALRRVSTYAEVLAENLIRKRLRRNFRNNQKLLDKELWVTYDNKYPVRLNPGVLDKDVLFREKIITDEDFTPTRLRRLIEFLQLLASDKNPVNMRGYNNEPIIKEIARAFEIDFEELKAQPVEMGDEEMLQRMMTLGSRLGMSGQLPKAEGNLARNDQEALAAMVLPGSMGSVEATA